MLMNDSEIPNAVDVVVLFDKVENVLFVPVWGWFPCNLQLVLSSICSLSGAKAQRIPSFGFQET